MFFYLGWQEEKKKEMLNLTFVIAKSKTKYREGISSTTHILLRPSSNHRSHLKTRAL